MMLYQPEPVGTEWGAKQAMRLQCKAGGTARLAPPQPTVLTTAGAARRFADYAISPAALRKRLTESDGSSAICVIRANVSR
jgi:hypothetical protein